MYTYGLQGTLALLMSPDGAGLPPARVAVTYKATGTLPPGYDNTVREPPQPWIPQALPAQERCRSARSLSSSFMIVFLDR